MFIVIISPVNRCPSPKLCQTGQRVPVHSLHVHVDWLASSRLVKHVEETKRASRLSFVQRIPLCRQVLRYHSVSTADAKSANVNGARMTLATDKWTNRQMEME